MKKPLRVLAAAAAVFTALAFSSCAYDPYYSSTSVGGSYSSGYGGGYGGSTSVFIATGDPHWGYDPTSYSYYDYRSRRYYDPYNYGYYPIGYRPRAVYGVSHPYGWRPGRAYIRPPVRVYDRTVSNYRSRSSFDRQRQDRYDGSRVQGDRSSSSRNFTRADQNSTRRQENNYRTSSNPYRETQRGETRQSSRSGVRQESGGRLPSRYNTPVKSSQRQAANRQESQRSGGGGGERDKKSDKEKGRVRGYR